MTGQGAIMVPRQKRHPVFWYGFGAVLLITLLVTVLTPSRYITVAEIPTEKLPTDTRPHLVPDDDWLAAIKRGIPGLTPKETFLITVENRQGMAETWVTVQGHNPKHCAALADAIAGRMLEEGRLAKYGPKKAIPAAVPHKPVYPDWEGNMIIGVVLGVIVGASASAIARRIDRAARGG